MTAAQLFQDQRSSSHSHLTRLALSAAPFNAGLIAGLIACLFARFCRNPLGTQDVLCDSLIAWLSVLQLSDDVNNCTNALFL